tara:strand:- start:198 stop:485 length:288 start_codon:yes stop_codon:yes gene_type:complete
LKTEGALQSYFKRQAASHGILWRKIKFEGQRGCPDILIAYQSKIVLIELKSPTKKGRLSELQKRQIKKFKDVGITVHVVDNKEQVDNAISEITNP